MDGGAMFRTFFLLFIVVGALVGAQSTTVPDDVVWTPPTATLWLGQTDPNIACDFLGTPLRVIWYKGDLSQTIVIWYKGVVSYGEGIDGTRFGISSSYSLLFNDLAESDGGTYICRVSNYNGYDIRNQTEVRVLDPRNVVAYTIPTITTWKGSSENLPCDFTGTASKVLWNKIDNSRQPAAVETVLRYADDTYEVIGSNTRFSWKENYQLHIRDIEVLDGANYTCKVWKMDGTHVQNSTVMTVYALPEEPYVQIAQCGRCMASQEGTNCAKCTHNVTADLKSFTLDCSVSGAKPKVTDITWSEGATGRAINSTQVVNTPREDGTFDTRVTLSASLSAIADVTSFTCTATGTAVNGAWTFDETVYVRVLPAQLPPFGITSGAKAALCIFFLLVLPIICCLLVFVYLYTYHRSVLLRVLPRQVVSCCTCLDLQPKPTNDGTSEEIQPLATKKTNETPDPLIAVLQEKRKDIINYIPGSKSLHEFPRNAIFNIGLYSIMSAEKSAFVNSLSFAVSGEYKPNVQEVHEGGSKALYLETVPLTRHLHILETRGIKELDEARVKRILDEIRGKQGRDTTKKVSGGTEIHCPVLVFKSSDLASLAIGVKFVKLLSDAVHRKLGRHVLIVITHKDELEKEREEEKDQQQGISGDLNEATYQRLHHEPIRSNDSNHANHGNVYDTIDGNVEEQNATAETAIENDTVNEGEESRVVTEKKNRGKAFLKHIKGKTHGSRKKDVEVCIDLEEQERLNVNESGEEGKVSNTTAVRDHSINDTSEDVNNATYHRLCHEPSRDDVYHANQGNVYDTLDENVHEQGTKEEVGIEPATANEDGEDSVEKDKPNRGKALLKRMKGKTRGSRKEDVEERIDPDEKDRLNVEKRGDEGNTIAADDQGAKVEIALENATSNEPGEKSVEKEKSKRGPSPLKQISERARGYITRKKDVEKHNDIEEKEIVNVSERVLEEHNYEDIRADETGNETGSFYDAEEELSNVNTQKECETELQASPDGNDNGPDQKKDYDGHGVVQSEGGNVTQCCGNTMSKWKQTIVDLTDIPEQNIWAFENYVSDKHDEDRERSIEFLDFLSVCLDTAERNAQFREEYIREKKNKTGYKVKHPSTWFSR